MARFTEQNEALALETIARYPRAKSALIPLLHLAQEQDGYVATDAMEHIAELIGITPAEVLGVCSFYEMFKREPVGRYLVNVCTNISCLLEGAQELLHHAETSLGVKAGGTTADGMITLEEVECIAGCTEAPCLQVNYRYHYKVDESSFDSLVEQLRGGRVADTPAHGTLSRVRFTIPAERAAGNDPHAGAYPVAAGLSAVAAPVEPAAPVESPAEVADEMNQHVSNEVEPSADPAETEAQ